MADSSKNNVVDSDSYTVDSDSYVVVEDGDAELVLYLPTLNKPQERIEFSLFLLVEVCCQYKD